MSRIIFHFLVDEPLIREESPHVKTSVNGYRFDLPIKGIGDSGRTDNKTMTFDRHFTTSATPSIA